MYNYNTNGFIFFYKNLTDQNLIKKITQHFEILSGYVLVESYDKANNILKINEDTKNNLVPLTGKLVNFNLNFMDVMNKICLIDECKFENFNTKYTIEKIQVHKETNEICLAYIIF